jgi:hypothetical protein
MEKKLCTHSGEGHYPACLPAWAAYREGGRKDSSTSQPDVGRCGVVVVVVVVGGAGVAVRAAGVPGGAARLPRQRFAILEVSTRGEGVVVQSKEC